VSRSLRRRSIPSGGGEADCTRNRAATYVPTSSGGARLAQHFPSAFLLMAHYGFGLQM